MSRDPRRKSCHSDQMRLTAFPETIGRAGTFLDDPRPRGRAPEPYGYPGGWIIARQPFPTALRAMRGSGPA
jgi:hypothetical protein